MSKIEGQVFTDKLEALRYARGSAGKFFETYGMVKEAYRQPLYVVAASEHQANLLLVEYLMPLDKWDRKKVNEQYIAALEDEMDSKSEEHEDQPSGS